MLKLELLTEENLDAVRAIHREDIPESWVDSADTLWELTRYGLAHHCIGHTYAVMQEGACVGVILLAEAFVASNAVSLAQAWLYQDAGDAFPFAIYNITPFTKNLPRLRKADGFSWRSVV